MRLQSDNLKIVQAGKVVYQKHFAVCHGAELEGQPDPLPIIAKQRHTHHD